MAPSRSNLKQLLATREDMEALREVERLLLGEASRALPTQGALADASPLRTLSPPTRAPPPSPLRRAVHNLLHPEAPPLSVVKGLFVRYRRDGYHLGMVSRQWTEGGETKLTVQVGAGPGARAAGGCCQLACPAGVAREQAAPEGPQPASGAAAPTWRAQLPAPRCPARREWTWTAGRWTTQS